MLPRRKAAQYLGLALLALLAAGLSLAALLQSRPVTAARATPAATNTVQSPPAPSPSAIPTSSSTPSPSESPSASPTATPSTRLTGVVVVGDDTSRSGADGWVDQAASELNWQVTNLSASGMAFTKEAKRCTDRCRTFRAVVPAIADAKPSIVVVFGGMADGDYPIGAESREFFTTLRKALPKATIVALSPVMTKDGQLGWVRLHRNNVKAAIAAVGGRYIDLEQPQFKSGALTAKGQKAVAKKVTSALGVRA